MQHLEPGFERVFTVTDYYDGPRTGIANYRDRPHLYVCEWDEAEDDYAETFLLSPVSGAHFLLALEDWEIWLRWERAFHEGRATRESHPALPDDRARHEELAAILKPALVPDPEPAIRAAAEFRPITTTEPGARGPGMVALQVRWLHATAT
ncbi:MAG: hypothetical protein MJE66_05370 [Proteobacteria bacterium]|nr:hypothetical protein [Pseudomonadota bacterium]